MVKDKKPELTITRKQFVDLVKKPEKKTFCSLTVEKVAKTLVKNRQTGEPFDGTVVVRSTYTGGMGYNYRDSVNNKRKKEGNQANFKPAKLKGKSHMDGSSTLLINDNGDVLFRLTLNSNNSPQKVYFLDGEEVQFENIKDVMPAEKREASNQISLRDFNIKSITEFRYNKKRYRLIG